MEVMVAIFIVVTGLTTVLVLLTQSISGATRSTNKLIAANLAQEGIEVVRNIRDLSYNGSDPNGVWTAWHTTNYSTGCTPNGVNIYLCSAQYNSVAFGSSYNTNLNFDSTTGLYSYGAGTQSIFKRTITLTRVSNAQLRVNSLVSWSEKGTPYNINVEDTLWNWR